MHGWTDQERRAARKLGIPAAPSWVWWWRARHVLNSPEREQLAAFTAWAKRIYAPEVAALRRRQTLRVVGSETSGPTLVP